VHLVGFTTETANLSLHTLSRYGEGGVVIKLLASRQHYLFDIYLLLYVQS